MNFKQKLWNMNAQWYVLNLILLAKNYNNQFAIEN
jgi:hypothetical protein